jgi:hypothetical protein
MVVRLFFALFVYSISILEINATSTITFLHGENTEVSLKDAVHPRALEYIPKFEYLTSTVFHVAKSDFHFYLLCVNSKEYYFWFEDSPLHVEIDLSEAEINSSNVLVISKSNWLSGNIASNNSTLVKLNEVDLLYNNALDSLLNLASTDAQYRSTMDFNTIVWDSRSAKRLYNLAVEEFSYQIDERLFHFSPEYHLYWQFMYSLYYQYYHTNSFKGQTKSEIKSTILTDFSYPESKVLMFYHFFNNGLTFNELKENHELFKSELTLRQQKMAEALLQRQVVKEMSGTPKIDFLFGIDIDGAMEGYFARDSSEKKNVLVFWSIWDSKMKTEFNLLVDLKRDYEEHYSFIHICIDAYETPERTKSLIYQNKVGGFHLLPEQANAFRKSNLRRDLKIRDFPFYVITDNSGKVIETEHIPLEVSKRLTNKIKEVSTKK